MKWLTTASYLKHLMPFSFPFSCSLQETEGKGRLYLKLVCDASLYACFWCILPQNSHILLQFRVDIYTLYIHGTALIEGRKIAKKRYVHTKTRKHLQSIHTKFHYIRNQGENK